MSLSVVWRIFQRYYQLLLKGTLITVELSLFALALGLSLGVVLALMRRTRFSPVKAVARVYIEIIRGTPLLLQLYIFVFGLPSIQIKIPPFYGVVLALGLNSAAYVSEIIRAGIQAVDIGQTEAARSLGMSSGKTMRFVVLPQAVRNILPALGNEFVMMIKETSLASTFFIGDLMTVRSIVSAVSFKTMEPLICVAIIYFVLTFSLGKLMNMLERRMAASE